MPSYLPAETSRTALQLPHGKQPALQLSLDYPMQENYDTKLLDHTGTGDWKGGAGMDGCYRNGAPFSPVVNCPSPNVGKFSTPRALRSASWLSMINAAMHDQLAFVYSGSLPWEQTIELAYYSTQLRSLQESILAPFGSVVHPTVAADILSPVSVQSINGVSARAWRVPGPALCVHLVCSNAIENIAPLR